ncbi:MAG: hypothetical protein ACJ8DQ_13255 [Xanthobacteraceae bacterium]
MRLLALGIQPLDGHSGFFAGCLRLLAKLLDEFVADVAGGRLGRDADFREPRSLRDGLSFLDHDVLNESGGGDGGPYQALVGNEPSGDRRLARIGRYASKDDAGEHDPAEQGSE